MIPDNLRPIWTPQDAIDTAQAFHAEIENAERGITVNKPRWTRKLFGRSRFRRAAIYDGLAVTLLVALMAALGTVVYAASAKADDSDARAYAVEYGPAVCSVLDDYPSFDGIIGIGSAIVERDSLSAYDAGAAIGYSVRFLCPRHAGLLAQFVSAYGHSQVATV